MFREGPPVAGVPYKGLTPARRERVTDGLNGEILSAAKCGLRGSPFHMPTRLADGLGPGSDPGLL
jgi:hypothetical protein